MFARAFFLLILGEQLTLRAYDITLRYLSVEATMTLSFLLTNSHADRQYGQAGRQTENLSFQN